MTDIKYCKQLIIEEQKDDYTVKFIDNMGNKHIVNYLKNDMGLRKMMDLVQLYINTFKVNGFNNFIPVYTISKNDDFVGPEVLLDNGIKKLCIKTNAKIFRIISKMVLDNYIKTREVFFENNYINEIKIDAQPNSSKFLLVDGVIKLTLETDLNRNICHNEKEFIINLLEYKCNREKIDISLISEKNTNEKMYIVSCGEFKISFPAGYTYSPIVKMINDHNEKIEETRKRR